MSAPAVTMSAAVSPALGIGGLRLRELSSECDHRIGDLLGLFDVRMMSRAIEHEHLARKPVTDPFRFGGRVWPVDVARSHDDQHWRGHLVQACLGFGMRL